MPNIIKNGAIVEDTYHVVTEAGALPAADIVVSLDVWQQQRAAMFGYSNNMRFWHIRIKKALC